MSGLPLFTSPHWIIP